MGKKSQRKLEKKKRKAKRKQASPQSAPLAYGGSKYKRDELVPAMFQAELGIHEADVITGREITDHDVRSALREAILQIRRGQFSDFEEVAGQTRFEGDTEELIIWNIRRQWADLFHTFPNPGRDNLVGVLRTILGSIDVWGSIHPKSRGYLDYIEKFVQKAGAAIC